MRSGLRFFSENKGGNGCSASVENLPDIQNAYFKQSKNRGNINKDVNVQAEVTSLPAGLGSLLSTPLPFAARWSHILRKPHLLQRKASQPSAFLFMCLLESVSTFVCGPVPAPCVLSLLLCFLHKRFYRLSFPLRLLFGFFTSHFHH